MSDLELPVNPEKSPFEIPPKLSRDTQTYRLKKKWRFDSCFQFDGTQKMAIELSDKFGWPFDRRPDRDLNDPKHLKWEWGLHVRLGKDSYTPLRANDWVCCDHTGGLFTMTDEVFKERYVLSNK